MIRSMTAFARAQKQLDVAQLCWEIRSVNHRYLDVSFRLPETFRFLEPQLRNTLKDTIYRGKLECQLKYQDNNTQNESMLINMGIVNALVDLGNQLSSSHHLANDLNVSKVLSWPGVVQVAQSDMEDLGQHVLSLFNDAVRQLSEFRVAEGQALRQHIETRLQALSVEVERAQSIIQSMAVHSKDKLLTRLHSIQLEVPEGRIEQEIALLLTRLDVSEELDRLQTHVMEVNKALNTGHSAGRRLDFLMQELNREANTLSSKSDSVELTQSAIEMKVLIEQMREQIQNIE
ncbi:YicC/YloC family endoribonuclease [Legionella sp. km772]|uniref:YicC/YloC family endoribonuclease n=1 Tax=Legionella sp. km772 TaxID=2498111 RepID=UPI000F8F2AD3|nr:YicC/YloC family endoribonuclease [Legionella sp. km772]RUR08431.1 YicC family protein [Legionella sp. km772]